jgi:hypothetical protein
MENGGRSEGVAEVSLGEPSVNSQQLVSLALKGLPQMFCPKQRLFCHSCTRSAAGLVRQGLSRTNTLITLIGLRKAEIAGLKSDIDTAKAFESLSTDMTNTSIAGDFGLYLWLCALTSDDSLWSLHRRGNLGSKLLGFRDARQCRTMELAWFLSGLSHAFIAVPGLGSVKDLAISAYRLLKENRGNHGLFLHASPTKSVSGRIRARIGTFADQIYPIYALAKFTEAFGIADGAKDAIACAEAVCRLQGPLGQWWWHYDSVNGRLVGRYPVYSVHQDGMAPMALFALSRLSGIDFQQWITRGLEWIGGRNELGFDLRDHSNSVIWRNIRQDLCNRYFQEALQQLRPREKQPPPGDLTVLFECRPYHLGWLLYAFAGLEPLTRSSGIG